MKKFLIISSICTLAGFVFGWVSSSLVQAPKLEQARQETAQLKQRITQLETAFPRVSDISRLNTSSAGTSTGSANVGFATGGAPIAADGQSQTPLGRATFSAGDASSARSAEQRESDRDRPAAAADAARTIANTRLESLRLALNLRPDQVARVNALLNSAISGENFSWREMRNLNQRIEQALEGTLSPDQITAMNTYKERENRARTEARTNFEYSMLDVALSLQSSQTDAVFNTLARMNSLENDPAFRASLGTDDRDAIRAAIREQKRASMSQLLTPEQMRVYEQFLETQDRFMRGMR